MATYSIKSPDGRTIQIRANDEATAVRGAQEWVQANPIATPGNVAQPSPALDQALAAGSEASGRFADYTPANTPQAPSIEGSVAATLGGLVNGIPVVGPMAQNLTDSIIGTGMQLTGNGTMQEYRDNAQARRSQIAEANPIASVAGNIGGGVAAAGAGGLTKTGAQALGMTGPVLQQMGNSFASTLGLTTADNMVRGQAPTEALANAVLPSTVAGVIPGVGAVVREGADQVARQATQSAQRKATDAAIAGAPDAGDLKSVASSLFKEVDDSGAAIDTEYLAQRIYQAAQRADKELIDSELDAPAVRLYNILSDRVRQAYEAGTGIPLGVLHNMRQIAQDIVVKGGGDRTGRFANQIVDMIDDVAENLNPSVMKFPANQIGDAASSTNAGNNLLKGISTWARARRVDLIEEALYKAQNQASGVENGLRTQFRALLQNKKTRNLFSAAEREAIEKVANGTGLSNLTRLLGTFGFELGSGRNAIGGALGLLAGGPVGAIIGTGSRKLAEVMATKAGQRAANVVATPNIPTVAPRTVPPAILAAIQAAQNAGKGAVLGGNAAMEGQPLRVVVNGAGSYGGQ